MSYWAKDGSFVREASDDAPRMTQGDMFAAHERVVAQAEAYEAEEARKKTAEREFAANQKYENFVSENRKAAENVIRMKEESIQREKEDNMKRYGVDYDLRNPKDLNERRARANFWRINNNFRLLVDTIIGKNYMFGKLWDQYSKAQTEEERQKIVEKMEKLYPTREFAVRNVEKKTGYRK